MPNTHARRILGTWDIAYYTLVAIEVKAMYSTRTSALSHRLDHLKVLPGIRARSKLLILGTRVLAMDLLHMSFQGLT